MVVWTLLHIMAVPGICNSQREPHTRPTTVRGATRPDPRTQSRPISKSSSSRPRVYRCPSRVYRCPSRVESRDFRIELTGFENSSKVEGTRPENRGSRFDDQPLRATEFRWSRKSTTLSEEKSRSAETKDRSQPRVESRDPRIEVLPDSRIRQTSLGRDPRT